MIEVRCKVCNHLLFKVKAETAGYLEIKCTRRSACKAVNKINLPVAPVEDSSPRIVNAPPSIQPRDLVRAG